jgi:multidrug efflux system outer membrane protein
MRKVWFCLLAISLSACMVGPDYRRPEVKSPGAWRFEEKEAQDLANTRWWRQFGDPVLEGLIGEALRENKDVKITAARVEQFVGRAMVTRSALFPQVAAAAVPTRSRVSQYVNPPWTAESGALNPYWAYEPFLSASWQIDLWGQLRRAGEAARADLLATREARQGVILTVVATVASAYTDLLDLDKQLDIAERTVASRADTLKLFKLRFDRGLSSELELRQAESEYQSALATVPLLKKLIGQQENALCVLLGRNPGPIPRGRLFDGLVLPAVPAGLPSELLERRPDIRQAEQNLIAANARIGVAKAQYYPNVTLTGLFGYESTSLSNLFTGPAKMWSYSAPVVAPIFTAGAIAGTVRVAEGVQREMLSRYEQVIQQAFREVEDGLIDQAKSREQLAVQARQVEALKAYDRLARIRYDNGYTSYIEVLDAERSLFAAQLYYAQTQAVLMRALINLYRSMGGGWVVEAESLAYPAPAK